MGKRAYERSIGGWLLPPPMVCANEASPPAGPLATREAAPDTAPPTPAPAPPMLPAAPVLLPSMPPKPQVAEALLLPACHTVSHPCLNPVMPSSRDSLHSFLSYSSICVRAGQADRYVCLPSLPFCSLPAPSAVDLFAVPGGFAKTLLGIARRPCGPGPVENVPSADVSSSHMFFFVP